MMSWWSSGANTALDEQIEKATSSSLEDIALNLEISDVIRSKTVQPKEAMRSLKKRIDNKNPNTQLSCLNLTDTCVKNGGTHFLTEIASREFMDNLTSLLNAAGPAAINQEVRNKILELIQSWASATEGRHELGYIGEVYRKLQREGFQFPPRTTVASSMIDSSAPPEWVDSDVCMRCRTAFTFTNRKHHCRNCGNCFDQQCSTKSLPLPHLGILQPVRVDDGCYAKLTDKTGPGGSGGGGGGAGNTSVGFSSHLPPKTQSAMQPRDARVEDSFDEDLKRALAMSLDEVQSHSRTFNSQPAAPSSSSYNSASKTSNSKSTSSAYGAVPKATTATVSASTTNAHQQTTSGGSAEEEDEDLKAAIAASLADMEEQKKKHAAAFRQQTESGSNGSASTSAPFVLPKNDYELTPVEAENINLFSTLVDRLQTQPPGTILREPQIQELYDSIGTLRPKLARTYGETMSKHDTLLDLHAKLSTVVRYYDRMLEERLSKAYNQHSLGGYNIPGPRQQQQQPPSMPYPSLQSSAPPMRAGGPAENFYTSEAAAIPDYARQMAQAGGYGGPQPLQPQYSGYDKHGSISGPSVANPYPGQPQRSDSWRNSVAPGQVPQGYPQQQQQPPQQQAQAPQGYLSNDPSAPGAPSAPPDPLASTPSADPNASYYFSNANATPGQVPPQQQQAQPSQPSQPTPPIQPQQTGPASVPSDPAATSPYPTLRQPSAYLASVPQTPATTASVPVQQQQAPTQQQQPPRQQQSPQQQQQQQQHQAPTAPYWSHPASQHQQVPQQFTSGPPQPLQQQPPQASWSQVPNNGYNNFGAQESFPSAPQHVPQQPVVEEALIEL
ncbi:hepatocyte growth factor-regulated tyrosine kinase substrate [Sporothrix brasiliensis 5110]|uniref:Vacuolar protein sorting-associated protein 27 n=1 Tax=Sporothrix brasiliensis 5110 TaxID=1398154 RepID=A0A0C2IN57_9PEZI|nr:hepatocyte growth factor-regulated tyrosine kinase substrate [Sporothrix brasiliensis 5110]KIH88420.1 hepatocyte growth factor-regulated tyrosine kinase substrate [Sporothrix brasiliensis 5110]